MIDAEVAELEANLKEARITDDRGPAAVGSDPFDMADDANQVIEQTQDNEEQAWLQNDRDYNYEQGPVDQDHQSRVSVTDSPTYFCSCSTEYSVSSAKTIPPSAL